MKTTRFLTVLQNDGTAVPLGIDEKLMKAATDVEAAATIDLHLLETRGELVMKFEVGSPARSQLFAVDFSSVLEQLIAANQTGDGNFPDPEDTVRSLELLARRLELEASLLRSKVANSLFDAQDTI